MKITFLTIGNKPAPWLDGLVSDYLKKISYWIPAAWNHLPSTSLGRSAKAKKKSEETQLLFKALKPEDFVLLCDEGGFKLDSMGMAKRLEQILNGGKKRLLIVVGGAYGVGEEVKSRADLQLCLSPFTINHHLALAVVSEQIYRAMTILKGTAYHNE